MQRLIVRAEMMLIKKTKTCQSVGSVQIKQYRTNSYFRAAVMTTIKMLKCTSKGAPRVDRCTVALNKNGTITALKNQ